MGAGDGHLPLEQDQPWARPDLAKPDWSQKHQASVVSTRSLKTAPP